MNLFAIRRVSIVPYGASSCRCDRIRRELVALFGLVILNEAGTLHLRIERSFGALEGAPP